jgi:diguanylate cyclase (GGDEF)-like protein
MSAFRRLLATCVLALLAASHAVAAMPAAPALVPAPVAAPAPVVVVDDGFRELALGAELEALEDPTGAMTLDAVRAAGGFRRVPASGLKIGFSESAWWVRVTLRNAVGAGGGPRALVLREAYPLMDDITLHAPTAGGGWRVVRTGDRHDFATREYAHRDFLFDIELPPGATQTYYLRFASDGPMDITLALYEPRALAQALGGEQLLYGAFFGGFLVLVLYNFFLSLVVRDRAFYWYLAYAASFGLYFLVFNGLSFQYLWPRSPAWANQSVLVLVALTVLLGLQFTRRFLDSPSTAPRIDRGVVLVQWVAIAALAGAFVLPYSMMILVLSALTAVGALAILALGVRALRQGFRPARWFLLAWALLLLGVLLANLKNVGLLPHNLLTQSGFQIGALCEMVLLSLALASRVGELQRQSRTDALTKVYNRRFFDERVAFELERAQRTLQPVSLLVADIDHFKKFNDTFGHARGDEVLKTVARALLDGVRSQDIVCRYGGEEFALILPGMGGIEAHAVAEDLRRAVARERGPTGEPVTISVGVATSADAGVAEVTDLFHAADEALYQAKHAGRNRVVRAGVAAAT